MGLTMRLFERRRGAISVFLSLILLPTVLFAGLMTDAVRIYQSESLVSEAGELAMNAGLSCYNTELKDHYGMLVMNQTPEKMQESLEQYFVRTIQASGLDGAEHVSALLDLRSENFMVKNVPGSEIYMPEVEKQQILEYMKYRGPVCIGGELLDKIDQIKKTKKQVEAVEAQMDFAETMDTLQEACEAANEAIGKYCEEAEDDLPAILAANINQDIEKVEEFLVKAVRYLFILDIIERYEERDDAADFMESMQHYNQFAQTVSGYVSDDAENITAYFEAYLACLYYQNNIPTENLETLIEQKKEAASAEDAGKLQETYDAYLQNQAVLSAYVLSLSQMAQKKLDEAWHYIGNWYARVTNAKSHIDMAIEKLNTLEETLRNAQTAHGNWKGKIDALSAGDQKTNMSAEAAEYEYLLNEEKLNALRQKLEGNKNSLERMREALEANTFCELLIANTLLDEGRKQIRQKISEWHCRLPQIMEDGSVEIRRELEDTILRFISANYVKTLIPGDCDMSSIRSDDFYKQLQEICKKRPESDAAKQYKDTTDGLLEQASAALDPIVDIDDIDWTAVTLPSEVLAAGSADEGESYAMTEEGGTGKSGRKKAIGNAKNTLSAISGFLDVLNQLLEEMLENLYLTEYGMQMFSYYTVNKTMEGQIVKEIAHPESISGDDLSNNKLYRAEVEYMLWGQKDAKKNVENTRLLLYGVRMLFNLIYAFSEKDIALFKNARNKWLTLPGGTVGSGSAPDHSVKMNYREYLTIFLLTRTFGSAEEKTLARIADCIQLNTEMDITKGYTMLAVSADVKSRTTFLRKAAELPDSGVRERVDDWYTISYQSVLGY